MQIKITVKELKTTTKWSVVNLDTRETVGSGKASSGEEADSAVLTLLRENFGENLTYAFSTEDTEGAND
jgi:hypothetical protein